RLGGALGCEPIRNGRHADSRQPQDEYRNQDSRGGGNAPHYHSAARWRLTKFRPDRGLRHWLRARGCRWWGRRRGCDGGKERQVTGEGLVNGMAEFLEVERLGQDVCEALRQLRLVAQPQRVSGHENERQCPNLFLELTSQFNAVAVGQTKVD